MVKSNDDLLEIEEDDIEFEAFIRELSPDMSATENVISTSISQHLTPWSMSMKLTGEKGYVNIALRPLQLKVLWARKQRKFQMMRW